MSELTRSLAPDRLRPWHEMVADMWITNPNLTQREIAKSLGRSEYWLSIVVNCDAFKEYMHARKEEIVDPILRASVEDRFRAVANVAAEKFLERLSIAGASVSNKELLDAMKIAGAGLGMGPQSRQPVVQQNLYVVPAPPKPANTQEWVDMVQSDIPRSVG